MGFFAYTDGNQCLMITDEIARINDLNAIFFHQTVFTHSFALLALHLVNCDMVLGKFC